jgi:hypothetical protein
LFTRELSRTRDALAQRQRLSEVRRVDADAMAIAADGSWFASAAGWRVSLARRPALRGIVRALVGRHLSGSGVPLSVDEMLTAGWPRERCVGSSGVARVYTAVARLRRLGLGKALLHDGAGYHLAPQARVDCAGGAASSCRDG